MNWIRHKGASRTKFLGLFVPFLLMVLIGCTAAEAALIEGILQNVDAANGEITIVTEDGKIITLTISTEAPVETEGASSAIETLEPGALIVVEVNDDGQVAQHIKARQAKLRGRIVGIEGNEVTIESSLGRKATVLVTGVTRIELEDDFRGGLADLIVGSEIEVKFDPESRVAFKIDFDEEEAEIEGVIIGKASGEVTIETKRGRRLTLVVGERTRIEIEDDFPGALADLQVGASVEAKFDPATRSAIKIELEEEDAKINGIIVEVGGNELTIETERGRRRTLVVGERTRIELEGDFPGTKADIQVGTEVEAKFDPVTGTAFKIKLKVIGGKEIEGVIVSVEGNEITIETESGRIHTFTIAGQTRIKLDDDFKGALTDLREGLEIELKFDTDTNVAFAIEVED